MSINKFIRETECQQITGLSRSTRWRMEKVGKFPKRIKISDNVIGWLNEDIENWVKEKVEAGLNDNNGVSRV